MPNKSSIYTCTISFLIFAFLTDLILISLKFKELSNFDDRILNIRNGRYCSEFCEPYPYQFDDDQCYIQSIPISSSIDKQVCRESELTKYQDAYGHSKSQLIGAVVAICFIFIFIRMVWERKRKENRIRENSLFYQHLINQNIVSQSIIRDDKIQEKEKYRSFIHQDSENPCSICLEYFKRQKSIKLNCRHIFHSICIKDWMEKQKKCPVCRSRQ